MSTRRLQGHDRVCAADGPCQSLDRAHPERAADSADSWSFTCATCGDFVCVVCQVTPVTDLLALCSRCGAAEADLDGLPPDPDDEVAPPAAPARGLGANRAAALLAERTGLADVHRLDVVALAERGHLQVVGEYREWPLYSTADLEAFAAVEELRQLIAERQAWLAISLSRGEAAALLGWKLAEFDQLAAEHGLQPAQLGRYRRMDVEAVAANRAIAPQAETGRDVDHEAER